MNVAKRKIEGPGGKKSVYEKEVAVVRYVLVMSRLFFICSKSKSTKPYVNLHGMRNCVKCPIL